MSPRRIHLGPIQEAEIEDLQQEIIRLKRRLSRVERRTDWSTPQDVNGFRPWGKYAPMTASRSFVPTKFLRTDDDDEGISDDQISSIPSSIEFSFKEFEDSLPQSSSLPLYDESVYDIYDDDMFFEVLDFDKPLYDEDQSKMEAPLELCMHIVFVKAINALACTDKENALQNTFDVITNCRVVSNKHSCEELVNRMINHLSQEFDVFRKKRWDMVLLNQYLGEVNEGKKTRLFCDVCWQMGTTVNRIFVCSRCKIDLGWTCPDLFSQPNPPP